MCIVCAMHATTLTYATCKHCGERIFRAFGGTLWMSGYFHLVCLDQVNPTNHEPLTVEDAITELIRIEEELR